MDRGMEKAKKTHRAHGRRTKAIPADPEKEHQETIRAFLKTFTHFFGGFDKRFGGFPDPRKPESPDDVDYSVASLVFLCVTMYACMLGARRQVRLVLFTTFLAQLFNTLFDVEKVPHGDTMNRVLVGLPFDDAEECVCGMTETLIDKRVLEGQRLMERYYVVAIDGTQLQTYRKRHCPHCLTRTHHEKTTYYHYVLEAKLVTPNGFAFSLMTEFVENEDVIDPNANEQQRKQDCELKAFYRLADRLHARFPRLRLVLAMDGLYAVGPVFTRCKRYHWNYMITLTDDQMASINEEFESLAAVTPENRLTWRPAADRPLTQQFRWVNDIDYVDSERRKHRVHVLECRDTRPSDQDGTHTTKFKWVTNVSITETNVVPLANEGGRLRWKIENEGFYAQKRSGYNLEHAYSQHYNGMKIYYLMLQIAHLVMQLLEKGNLLRKTFPRGGGSLRDLARRLVEALRNAALTPEQYHDLCNQAIQIRLGSP
jgi:hypothetical protein